MARAVDITEQHHTVLTAARSAHHDTAQPRDAGHPVARPRGGPHAAGLFDLDAA